MTMYAPEIEKMQSKIRSLAVEYEELEEYTKGALDKKQNDNTTLKIKIKTLNKQI